MIMNAKNDNDENDDNNNDRLLEMFGQGVTTF